MRRSQTGFRPDQGRLASRARRRRLGLEPLEERALLAVVTEFPIPTSGSQPSNIVAGPDGNLWFTETGANAIGKLDPTTGQVTEIPIPTPGAGPLDITAGPVGSNAMYFTESTGSAIGVVDVTNDSISEIPIPIVGTTVGTPSPFGITLGSDGNIWFTDNNPQMEQIGQLVVATNSITEFPLDPTTGAGLTQITTGADGNLWFVESQANQLGQMDPNSHIILDDNFGIPTPAAGAFGITSRLVGDLWFTEQTAGKIGSFNITDGTFNETLVPALGSSPKGITPGPDTSFWFTEPGANQIGRIDPTTQLFQQFAVPTASSGLNGITTGPDGAIWFVETDANQIGRLDLTQILQATGTTIAANQGAEFTGVVASFTSAALGAEASDFTATIDWGDGTTTAASAIAPAVSGVGFNVAGAHTYAAQGTFQVVVTINDNFGDTAAITSTANVQGPVVPPIVGPIPVVTGLVRTGIHRQPSQITLTFSTALNPTQANNALNYSIIGLGRNGILDAGGAIAAGRTDDTFIHVLTAVYDPTLNTVTLTTFEHLSLNQKYQITVHSGPPAETANGLTPDGLQSPKGVYLAGVDNTPGTDFVAVFRGSVVPSRAGNVRIRGRHPRPAVAHHLWRRG